MNAPGTPTVFLVDDDAGFLRSLVRLLRTAGYRVASHASATAFLSELEPGTPGCVITDLCMPECDGLALQRELERRGNPLPVIFLTGQGDIPTTVQAMRRGAEDYLEKTAPKERLLDAIRRALERDARERTDRLRHDGARRAIERLSPREREILGHVLEGKLNKQIAADLRIHERTVKLHRTTLCRKLDVHSVAELARLLHEAGIGAGELR